MARVSTRRNQQPPVAPRTAGRVNPVRFLQETLNELKPPRTVWPSREETARLTVIVLILAGLMSAYLGGLDRIFDATFTRFVLLS
ncbi:MAG: preprotein translocase subunit SecE [Dehalococcoidia bacterium]